MIKKYDIVLLPDDKLAEFAIDSAGVFKELDNYYVIEYGKFYPHLSLYMMLMDECKVSELSTLVGDIAAEHAEFGMLSTCFYQSHGYIFIDYMATEEIVNLQSRVLEGANLLREKGLTKEMQQKIQLSSGIECQNLETYGYEYIGELFRPHITFTKLKIDSVPNIDSILPDKKSFSGIFNKIGIFELGKYGTCIKPIATFKLR